MANAMKAAAAVLFSCLLLVRGGPQPSKGGCVCHDAGVIMRGRRLVDEVVVYQADNFCPRMEIIVTLKNGQGKRCLNLQSQMAKNILQRST